MNILLVDDDDVDRAIVKRTINRSDLNFNITESKTVDEGLRKYAEGNFDIILLDYRMPQRDGIEMIVELRNEPKDSSTAVVMMSSSEDEELALKCIRAGAQDFLVKTEITATRLRRAIQHATTRFELEMQLFKTYQQVKILAETDSLTELPNRYFFDETLKQAITNNRRSDYKLALLLIDIDNFKLVNDNFGHDTGDVLLKKIVSRIKSCLRGNELLARLGGDEFAITLSNLESVMHANMVAARIITIMKKPLEIAGTTINSTVSIGVAMHPDNGISSEELFKFADIAMYRAKKRGRNQVCFFEDEMQEKFLYRLKIESELRKALGSNSELELYYQPIINPFDDTTHGFEALVRWRVEGILRSPDEFIGIAEETKLIAPLGLWVADKAIETISVWNVGRKEPLRMAINVSALQLADNSFVEHLEHCLLKYGVLPELVDIELTETALLRNTTKVAETISRINMLGCKLSLDDFGTGYSSLSHLRNYPFSIVKIDKSLMPKNDSDKRNFELVEGVVAMAKILHMDIVAEGVETDLHVNLCKRLNIERIQGYYYSQPVSYLEIESNFL